MSGKTPLNNVKFLMTPVKSDKMDGVLVIYEIELIEEMIVFCITGEGIDDRVVISGPLRKKAAYVLVKKGLAGYVKNCIYPSALFKELFLPLVDEESEDHTHQRIAQRYREFLEETP